MSLHSDNPLFAHFDSEQHLLWKRDRILRQRIPLSQTWRGCLRLAALLENVEQTEYPTDRHALIPNENLTWLALRDVPHGHYPAVPSMNRRDVQYVNLARATLRYGMPQIDFTQEVREAWDLRFMPFGHYQRPIDGYGSETLYGCGDVLNSEERPVEFAALNRMNAAMTRFAFCAIDRHGRAIRQSWAEGRPSGQATFTPSLPGQWMPRPYLAFHARYAADITQHAQVKPLRLQGNADAVLFPADRVHRIVHDLQPLALWWDLQPCCRHIDGQLEAAIFPPIPLQWWDHLRFGLPGEVQLIATIADPRLVIRATHAKRTMLRKIIRGYESCRRDVSDCVVRTYAASTETKERVWARAG